MKICVVLLMMAPLMVNNHLFAQDIETPKLENKWFVEIGFPQSTVRFRAIKNTDEGTVYDIYEFMPNGEIAYSTHAPKGLGQCGNGRPFVTKATWKLKGKMLNIYIKGGHALTDYYEYNLDYKITKLTKNKLVLTLVKINQKSNSRGT